MSRYVASLIALVVAATVSAAGAQDAVVSWFRAQAIPIQTPEAGHGFDDLQPLKKVVGNARIVALGEATHGTREFFQLKHRLLEFLATEMGFTIFSIEANMPEAYRLNDYVLTGTGDPKQLLRGMYFWTWDTEEVLDMILWMRRFNESGKGRVEFTGFDM
jgi:erythromycin esterase